MIRWITSFLGTAPASSLILESGQQLLDVRELIDSDSNHIELIQNKIEEGLELLRKGYTVIIGCDYGISRSNAIAAGLLSVYQKISFNDAVNQVISATGEDDIKLGPLNTVRMSLEMTEMKRTSNTRILIIGGSGLVGSALQTMLAKKWSVFAPIKRDTDLLHGAVQLDLTVRELKITHLIHLANPAVYTSIRAMGESMVMLRNAIDVCESNDLHLIYPSCGEIYSGYSSLGVMADEKLPPKPKGVSGETKWLCELLIDYHRKNRKLLCGLLRSAVLYGSNKYRPKFLYTFIDKARSGKTIYTHEYRNGFPGIDIMHVCDFCTAISKAIDKNFVGNLNLGTGRLVTTRDMAIMIREFMGSKSLIESIKIDDDAPNIAMESSKAFNLFSWKPIISFEEGIKNLLSSYLYRI